MVDVEAGTETVKDVIHTPVVKKLDRSRSCYTVCLNSLKMYVLIFKSTSSCVDPYSLQLIVYFQCSLVGVGCLTR